MLPLSYEGRAVTSVSVKGVRATVTSVGFFDRLSDETVQIVHPTGQLRKCFESQVEEIVIDDRLREVSSIQQGTHPPSRFDQ